MYIIKAAVCMELGRKSSFVMAWLGPAIHVFVVSCTKDVDARHRAGHDEFPGNAAAC
jgi:hypothetical protein